MKMRWTPGMIALSAALMACGGSVQTTFPPGVEPAAAQSVEFPEEQTSEGLAIQFGEDDEAGGVWVHAKGFVPAPIEEVAEAFKDPALMVDQKVVSDYSATWDVEPEYPVSVRVHQVIEGLVTVEFDVTWRGAALLDAQGHMEEFAAVYQKTEGSSFIDRMGGSIRVRRVDDQRSSVEIVAQLDAYGVSPDELAESVLGMYTSLLIAVK